VPGFINRVPLGLLGLLDLKQQGESPAALAPLVNGVIDLTHLYASQTRAAVSQASTVTGVGVTAGAFSNLVVPQGELWLVYGMTATLSVPPLGAGATAQYQVGFVDNGIGRFNALGIPSPSFATGADGISDFDGAILLQPGDAPQVYVTVQTGGGVGVRLTVLKSRFAV
jgi:hypothetical protein